MVIRDSKFYWLLPEKENTVIMKIFTAMTEKKEAR